MVPAKALPTLSVISWPPAKSKLRLPSPEIVLITTSYSVVEFGVTLFTDPEAAPESAKSPIPTLTTGSSKVTLKVTEVAFVLAVIGDCLIIEVTSGAVLSTVYSSSALIVPAKAFPITSVISWPPAKSKLRFPSPEIVLITTSYSVVEFGVTLFTDPEAAPESVKSPVPTLTTGSSNVTLKVTEVALVLAVIGDCLIIEVTSGAVLSTVYSSSALIVPAKALPTLSAIS